MRIGVRPGHPHYVYPPQWDAQKLNRGFGPIYESGIETEAEKSRQRRFSENSQGIGYEEVLIGVQDEDASGFLAANGTSVNVDGVAVPIVAEVIDRNAAVREFKVRFGEPIEKITDRKVVDAITIKRAKGETLTPEEEKAIDPNDPTPGINRTKTFEESIDEALAQ